MDRCNAVLRALLSTESINILNQYLDEKQQVFESHRDSTSDYSHEQYQIYQSYIELVEGLLVKYCRQSNVEVNQLHEYVRDNSESDPYIDLFSNLFVKIYDFDLFREYIIDKDKRNYLLQIIKGYNS